MGGTSFDYTNYHATAAAATSPSGQVQFAAPAPSLDPLVDPLRKNKAGIIIRESLDSPGTPESKGLVWQLDVTGSMSHLPGIIIKNLGTMMTLFKAKNVLPGVHIMSMTSADSYGDRHPVQATCFESGNEIENALLKFQLGGGGGGPGSVWSHETYGLAMLFAAHYAKMDCLEKRGEKGYYFIIGDERAYDTIQASHAKQYLDIDLESDISFDDVLAKLREKFEVYWLYPIQADYYRIDPSIHQHWKQVFGANYIEVEQADTMASTMVALVAAREGMAEDDVNSALKDAGVADTQIAQVSKSLTVYRKNTGGLTKTTVSDEAGLLEVSPADAEGVGAL